MLTENLNDREWEPESTLVDKYYFIWSTKCDRCLSYISIIEDLHKGPLYMNIESKVITISVSWLFLSVINSLYVLYGLFRCTPKAFKR